MPKDYDYIVIGGGSAGYAAARTACAAGARVALVDGAQELGGLCILRGCMPSKTLLYSAEVLHLAQRGGLFGLEVPSAKAKMPALHKRKQHLVAEFAGYRVKQLESGRFDLLRQRARFTGPRELTLADGTVLKSAHFFVGTGSVVSRPPVPGLDKTPTLTSDEILELNHTPTSVIVLGGGVVACELAQFLQRIGSKVTLIQRSQHILKEHSVEAAQVVEKALRDEGMEVLTDTKLEETSPLAGGGARVAFTHQGVRMTREATVLFNALGRSPATTNLGLEAAGVTLTKTGHIQINEFMQSSNPAIHAGGDCTGPHEIVHAAILQGEIGARHALGKQATPINYGHLVRVVFTDPQVAVAGYHEKELRAQGVDFVAASYPFDDHGKSILMEAKRGYVKILAQRPDGKILGAECVGRDASELIHAIAPVLPLNATVHDLLRAHWYHPTLAEIWTYPLEECAEALPQK